MAVRRECFIIVAVGVTILALIHLNASSLRNDNQRYRIKDTTHERHVQRTPPRTANRPPQQINWLEVFNFVPNVLRDCKQLFPNKTVFPDSLQKKYAEFEEYANKAITGGREGSSGEQVGERMVFHELVKAPHVRTVCETGFNDGHSSFMWLESKHNIKVYSFDIGIHDYAKVMAAYLQKEYPGRLVATWGDSSKTLPQFHQTHPHVSCDLVYIDGGHSTDICLADFYNFQKMSHKDTLIILDNYPEARFGFESSIGNCWERLKKSGEVMEIFNCNFDPTNLNALGITVARYVF